MLLRCNFSFIPPPPPSLSLTPLSLSLSHSLSALFLVCALSPSALVRATFLVMAILHAQVEEFADKAPVPECIEPQLCQIKGHVSRQKAAACVQLCHEMRDARDMYDLGREGCWHEGSMAEDRAMSGARDRKRCALCEPLSCRATLWVWAVRSAVVMNAHQLVP